MLRQRVLTALALIIVFAAAILALPTTYLSLIFAFVALLAAGEWARLSGVDSCVSRLAYLAVVALCLYAGAAAVPYPKYVGAVLTAISVCWIGIGLGLLARRSRALDFRLTGVSFRQLAAGLPVLAATWLALVFLHGASDQGPAMLLFLMVLIWVTDSGAYFAGRRWGRNKLASAISPGKTLEGAVGALVSALVCGLAWALAQGFGLRETLGFVLLCLVTGSVSIVGDLFESMMKRLRGLKDSGGLLPGHGGILDRIDSLASAAPVFVSGLWLLGDIP